MGGWIPQVQQGAKVEAEQSSTRTPLVSFLTTGVAPPGALYMQEDDELQIQVQARISSAPFIIQVRGRFLLPNGRIIPIESDCLLPIGVFSTGFFFPLGEGYLLGLTVNGNPAIPNTGQVYASVNVVRGGSLVAQSVQCLCAGIVTLNAGISWPASGVTLATDHQGLIRSITGTTPGAGADISESVPAGVRWRLVSFKVQLATSAVVANRLPQFIIDDGANFFFANVTPFPVTASQTVQLVFSTASFQTAALAGTIMLTAPQNLFLPATFRIRTSTVGLQAADQFSALQYNVEEWQVGA